MTHKLDPVLDAGLRPEATFMKSKTERSGATSILSSTNKANQNACLRPMKTAPFSN